MFDQQGIDGYIGQSFNGYRITSYIARGGMGVVYKGEQESLHRPVAIKILYPHLSSDESFRERFSREARAAAQLTHPNIVRVIDFGRYNDSHYMVLDYIEGESLREYLARLHREGLVLRTDRLVKTLQEVAAALGYAHEQGFVHRDVKPGNILLTLDGRALLTDFGVVKSTNMSQLTNAGAVIGTPEYVAPEQSLDAAAIGPAADQYSLGIVAYEMLTGRVPFQGQTPTAMLRMHMSEPPPPPTRFAGWLPPAAEAVVLQALAKQPEDRHPSVTVFIDRLAETLLQQQPEASTPAPWQVQTGMAAATGAVTVGASQAQWPVMTPGDQTPPPPPPPPEATDGGGSGGRHKLLASGLAGLFLLMLLACAVGGYFVFLRDEDDDTLASATSTSDTGIGAPVETSESEQIAAETPLPPAPTETVQEVIDPTATDEPEEPTEPAATEAAGGEASPTEVEETVAPTLAPSCTEFILFATHRGEVHDSQIYIMNTDGTDQRQLTFARGHSWGPRVSPDGSMFVFSSVAPGEHSDHSATGGGTHGSGNHQIYLSGIDGNSINNLTVGSTAWNNAWAWSPDGSLITFTSDRHGNWELYTMAEDGSGIVRLTNTAENEGWPSWTPDGQVIVYASDVTGTSEVYIMDSDGTNRRQLTDAPDRFNTYPFVSPDGTKIVFSSQVTAVNEGEIYVMDIDGGNMTRLTSTAALNYAPSWSPDGSKIVFVSDRDGNDNIWVMNADGTNQTRLTTSPGEDTTPDWAYTCAE